jgi:GT2 family glycosyltransferase
VGDRSKLGSSAARNFAASHARGDYLVFLSNTIEVVSADWLREMIAQAVRPGVGAVGARLLSPNGTVIHAGMILGIGGVAGNSHRGFPVEHAGYFGRAVLTQSLSAVSGACLAIRKSIYQEIGGLNETQLPSTFSDVDLCMRLAQTGHRNVYAAHAELCQHASAADLGDGLASSDFSAARYMAAKWGGALDADPAYNPNLTLEHEDFSYAWPPRVPTMQARER